MRQKLETLRISAGSESLSAKLDPVQLYAHLTENGARADTMIFARPGGPSLILAAAAVRIECRGKDVRVTALSDQGPAILDGLKRRHGDCLIAEDADHLVFRFEPSGSDDPDVRLRAAGPFDILRSLSIGLGPEDSDPFSALCMGVIGYDHADFYEDLPPPISDPLEFPDLLFWLAESAIIFEEGSCPRAICVAFAPSDVQDDDTLKQRLAELIARCEAAPALDRLDPASVQPDHDAVDIADDDYEDLVAIMKAHIRNGDVYQIVPSRTFRAQCPNPFRAFRALSALEPSSYHFFIAGLGHRIFGASPEFALRVTRKSDGILVESNPIAGTRPRGGCPDEDDRLELDLRTDPKEIAEHVMLVDLARNDVARISQAGTRRVSALMTVRRHARVMHLESVVEGRLLTGLDAFHGLSACLNVGTLTGAPKIRAMQLLREAEPAKRGPYGGAVGWINGEGDCDTAVVIRTAVVRDGTAFVRAGAGVVFDSDPQSERRETEHKSAAVLTAIAGTAA